MISIVLYGRNDNHGYNLHKRAALSLNCLAEVLRAPDDEIIFVDYNSPDELPTFPEAISDTLTAQARSVLRIFRVRPGIHDRYAAQTHLLAVEPVARNVGVRRSNPENRWILSTNSDDILLLRQARNLAEIVGDLPPGLYHTARFEVPESLWESFDRSDPHCTMRTLRTLGRSARLNEVIYGSPAILFDGPGDFQLVERAKLFEIDGFDEKMLRGWHVDSNLAKRLSLDCGAIGSLLDQVYCYHCDHTRQATTLHRQESVVNDYERFVGRINRPDLPEQRQSWGCAGDVIEEIRLPQNGPGGYRRMLPSLIRPFDRDFSETYYTSSTYDRTDYDPQRVLLFFADLLNHLPRDTRLAWCGLRPDMFELVRQVWSEFGFSQPIAVHDSVEPYLLATPGNDVVSRGQQDWLAEADLFGFEFGRTDPQITEKATGAVHNDEAELQPNVQSIFLAAVVHERSRQATAPAALPRRFVAIDCIHNRMEKVFMAHVAAALTPFGSRLRHGFLAGSGAEMDPDTTARLLIGHALGRSGPISRKELDFAQRLFAPLLQENAIAAAQTHRMACHAALGREFIAATANPRNATQMPETAKRAIALLEQLRPSTALAAELGVACRERVQSSTVARPLSRFATFEDWDDPSWCAFAEYYVTDVESNSVYRRDAALWEQIHLLYGLDRAGGAAPGARVLVVATMPDAAIAAISRWAPNVEVLSLAAGAPAGNAAEARAFWCNSAPYNPGSLAILPIGTAIELLESDAYDFVVFPHGAMFGAGLEAAIGWMREAERLLRPNGLLVFTAEIAAGPRPHPDYLDVSAVGDRGLAARLATATAFWIEGGFDATLSRSTVDKVWPETGPDATERYFLSRKDGRVLVPSYWFLTKREPAGRSEWDQVRQWLVDRWSGEQIALLLVGAAGRRCDDGRIESLPGKKGHVFFGPYVAPPVGRYRVTLHIEKSSPSGRKFVPAAVEAVVNGKIIASARFDRATWAAGAIALDFEVRGTGHVSPGSVLEIRLHSPGRLSVIVVSVDLQSREACVAATWPRLPSAVGRSGASAGAALTSVNAPHHPSQNGISERRELDFAVSPDVTRAHRPLSRIAADEDWEDPAWSRFLDFGSPQRRPRSERRDVGEWERTHLLYGLDRCGMLALSRRILVVATMPDEVVGLLSEFVGRLDVLDLSHASDRRGPEARLYWSNGALYARDRLTVHEPAHGLDSLDESAYDVIVFPHSSLFFAGTVGIAALMSRAERALALGGLLVFKAEILTGNEPDTDYLDASLFAEDAFVTQIETNTGFAMEQGLDPRLAAGSASSIEPPVGAIPRPGGLAREHRGRLALPSLWFLRKRGHAPAGGCDRLRDWLLRRLLGDQLDRLELGPAGYREAGRILTNGLANGMVFFGPYLALPSGRYEAVFAIEPAASKRGRLLLEVVADAKRLNCQKVRLGNKGNMTVRVPFTVPLPRGDGLSKIEVRARLHGGEIMFAACSVNELEG